MARLLHLADVHLGAPLGGFGKEAEARAAEILDAFRSLPEIVEAHDVEAVLIVGDLFDGPRPPDAAIIAVRETVRRLLRAAVPVFAVPGNHDARALDPDLYPRALEGATVFEAPRFGEPASAATADGPLLVYGFSYDAAEESEPLATFRRSSEEGLHVALMHGSTPGAPHWQRGSALPLAWDALAALDVDYLALGDLHRFRGPEELEGLPACYPGSFAAVDVTEWGLRGPVLVDVTPGDVPDLRRISAGVREVGEPASLDVSGCASDLEVADAVTEAVPDGVYPVVELRGEPGFPLDAEKVQAILVERCGSASVTDRSRFFEAGRLREIARRNTVAGHVARLGLERIAGAATADERAALEGGLRLALRALEVG